MVAYLLGVHLNKALIIMELDVEKISGILFTGAVQAIVSLLLICVTYWVTNIQSDKRWKRKLAQDELNRIREVKESNLTKRISALQSLIALTHKVREDKRRAVNSPEISNLIGKLWKLRLQYEYLGDKNLTSVFDEFSSVILGSHDGNKRDEMLKNIRSTLDERLAMLKNE